MMARLLTLLLAFVSFSMPVQAIDIWNPIKAIFNRQSEPPKPTIKVLVLHDQNGAALEIIGKYKIFDPHTGSLISTRFLGKSKMIQPHGDGLKWGEEFPGHHQLEFVATEPDTKFLVNGIEYKGNLVVYDIGGSVSIVNELPIEDYLSLTLDSKLSKDLSDEALAALVIADRTNAYYLSKQPKRKYWSVDGSQAGYQGYYSVDPENAVQKAIKSTRNMVLSKTAAYEGIITPFPAQWSVSKKNSPKMDVSRITVEDVAEMSDNGSHAATILEKAFPKTSIQLIQ